MLPTDQERLASLEEQGTDLAAMANVDSYDPKVTYDDCNPINPIENLVSDTTPPDFDADGIPDYLDEDDNNDGILDIHDEDNDGVSVQEEDINGDGDPTNDDTDGDGIPDFLDADDDGDGIATVHEDFNNDGDPSNDDTDGDGIPDYLDSDELDSSGDAISDSAEGNGDTDSDGIPDFLDTDTDNDGILDVEEGTADSDNDGIPNYQDTDDDGDGILTVEEDINGDGDPTNDDSDGDGIPPDVDEGVQDTDSDGIPDYVDQDDDGDGISNEDEDTDGDGDPTNDDEDGDGIPDFLDDNDDEPSIGEGGINETPAWATAGTLTVSESKDLEDWNYWNSIESEYQRYQDDWGLYPKHRVSVEIKDLSNKFCVDKTLYLINDNNQLLWTARTDNKGTAELWINYTTGINEDVWLIVLNDDQTETIYPVHTFENGVNHIQLDGIAQEQNNCDILIAFDATGSMNDELQFIKAEVRDVLTKLENNHSDVSFRYSSVFYRDHDHDTYVTNSMTFSPFKNDARNFINQQNVATGIDVPEAVHTGMQMSIVEQDWSKSARARIMFLILDAPPHNNSCVVERIQVLTKEAARKGIKLIPIAASDSDKETEFLMRFSALLTNGTYGYITDDSGIGNDHQEASVGEPAAVEYLNDMMLRVVSENLE